MKTHRLLLPLAISLAATPILLFLGVASAGAGHGNYLFAKILFPHTLLSAWVLDSITTPFIVLAVIQFPLYGIVLGAANLRHRFKRTLVLVGIIHALAVGTCFILLNEQFA